MQGDLLNSSMKDLRGEVHFTFSKCSKALRIDYKLKKKKKKFIGIHSANKQYFEMCYFGR